MMTEERPVILDLYCSAGGAAMGYYLAGFDLLGIDKDPQPRYPFAFVQMDAIEAMRILLVGGYITDNRGRRWYLKDFAGIHASPPCQKNSTMTKGLWKDRLESHPELIAPTRDLLIQSGKPYVIENVQTAPMITLIVLCGSMFGLKVRKHRMFECSFMIIQPSCQHKAQGRVVAVYGHTGGSSKRDGLSFGGVATWKEAMQIDWMIAAELAEAIPPAYTKYIGTFMIDYITRKGNPDNE